MVRKLPIAERRRIALAACRHLVYQEDDAGNLQEAIDLARIALGLDTPRRTRTLCGTNACTLSPGHGGVHRQWGSL